MSRMDEQRTIQARAVAQLVNEPRGEARGNTGEYDPVQLAGRGRGRGRDQEAPGVGQVGNVQAPGVPQPPNVDVNQLAAEVTDMRNCMLMMGQLIQRQYQCEERNTDRDLLLA